MKKIIVSIVSAFFLLISLWVNAEGVEIAPKEYDLIDICDSWLCELVEENFPAMYWYFWKRLSTKIIYDLYSFSSKESFDSYSKFIFDDLRWSERLDLHTSIYGELCYISNINFPDDSFCHIENNSIHKEVVLMKWKFLSIVIDNYQWILSFTDIKKEIYNLIVDIDKSDRVYEYKIAEEILKNEWKDIDQTIVHMKYENKIFWEENSLILRDMYSVFWTQKEWSVELEKYKIELFWFLRNNWKRIDDKFRLFHIMQSLDNYYSNWKWLSYYELRDRANELIEWKSHSSLYWLDFEKSYLDYKNNNTLNKIIQITTNVKWNGLIYKNYICILSEGFSIPAIWCKVSSDELYWITKHLNNNYINLIVIMIVIVSIIFLWLIIVSIYLYKLNRRVITKSNNQK